MVNFAKLSHMFTKSEGGSVYGYSESKKPTFSHFCGGQPLANKHLKLSYSLRFARFFVKIFVYCGQFKEVSSKPSGVVLVNSLRSLRLYRIRFPTFEKSGPVLRQRQFSINRGATPKYSAA